MELPVLVDVDNDWDLDIIVSAYAGDKASLFLFANDGAGSFTDASAGNLTQESLRWMSRASTSPATGSWTS